MEKNEPSNQLNEMLWWVKFLTRLHDVAFYRGKLMNNLCLQLAGSAEAVLCVQSGVVDGKCQYRASFSLSLSFAAVCCSLMAAVRRHDPSPGSLVAAGQRRTRRLTN